MKTISPLITCGAAYLLATAITNAAFIIATDGSLGAGNYAYTGPGGTAASVGVASAGQLPATTDVPATFFTLNHVYGGNGTTDQYTFTYSPSLHNDNFTVASGTLYNSLGANPDLRATGLSGGGAGIYNVYRIHPGNPTVSGGNTTYRVSVNSTLTLTEVIDQNAADLTNGRNIGRWELIGSVNVLNAADVITVTMAPDTSTFVSMRASGIMFEYVAPIPEPGSVALLCLGAMAFCGRHRR
jgi:hypothetical protein